jgi:ubiquinone/menaquinone biosynthesis C-methylase UbiE
VTLALARLAGPAGEAVGIDIDEVKLRLARDEAADAGVENVDYRAASVDELPQDGELDLVYARSLSRTWPIRAPRCGR